MAQQTAVEWLNNNMPNVGHYIPMEVALELHAKFQQAERMHEEQVIDFGKKCQMVHDVEYGDGAVTFLFTPEELYEQTYKTQVQ